MSWQMIQAAIIVVVVLAIVTTAVLLRRRGQQELKKLRGFKECTDASVTITQGLRAVFERGALRCKIDRGAFRTGIYVQGKERVLPTWALALTGVKSSAPLQMILHSADADVDNPLSAEASIKSGNPQFDRAYRVGGPASAVGRIRTLLRDPAVRRELDGIFERFEMLSTLTVTLPGGVTFAARHSGNIDADELRDIANTLLRVGETVAAHEMPDD